MSVLAVTIKIMDIIYETKTIIIISQAPNPPPFPTFIPCWGYSDLKPTLNEGEGEPNLSQYIISMILI